MKNKVLKSIFAATIGMMACFSLLYFVFDLPMREAIFSTLGGEVGFLIAWFLVNRAEQKKKGRA